VLTVNGLATISRYVLRPKTNADTKRLQELEGISTVVPMDDYLHLTKLPFKMTPEVMLNTAFWAQNQSSYQEAEDAILRAHQSKINDDTIRQITNYIGAVIFQADCKRADEAFNLLNQGRLRFPKQKKKGVLYIEADGAALNTRSKDETGSSWRENKLGVVFSSDNMHTWTNKHGEKQHRILKREYVTYVGGVHEFKKHLFSCALKNGYGEYEKVVLLSDGATWIRNVREELFPDAQQILDFFHLCENVCTFAKHVFGTDASQYAKWADEICVLLKDSKSQDVLNELKKLRKPSTCSVDLYGYIKNNASNIDYAKYIDDGLFIGSGASESGNKSVLHQRLKQAGMRWNVQTAQYLLSLRAKYKSELWQQEVERPIFRLLQ